MDEFKGFTRKDRAEESKFVTLGSGVLSNDLLVKAFPRFKNTLQDHCKGADSDVSIQYHYEPHPKLQLKFCPVDHPDGVCSFLTILGSSQDLLQYGRDNLLLSIKLKIKEMSLGLPPEIDFKYKEEDVNRIIEEDINAIKHVPVWKDQEDFQSGDE
jgi:hypothetical protein